MEDHESSAMDTTLRISIFLVSNCMIHITTPVAHMFLVENMEFLTTTVARGSNDKENMSARQRENVSVRQRVS
jgi:hypothetical protein